MSHISTFYAVLGRQRCIYQRYIQFWVANVAYKFKISTFYAVLGACKFKISTLYVVLGGQRCMQVQDINVLCSPGWPTLHISKFYAVLGGQRCIYQRYIQSWVANVACKFKISMIYAVLGSQLYMQVQDINDLCSPGWPTLYASSRYQRFMQSWVANVASSRYQHFMQCWVANVICKFKISTLYAVLGDQHCMQVQDINVIYSPGWPILYASSRYQCYMHSWEVNIACKFKISTFYAVLGACKFKISMFHTVLGGQRCMQVQDINVLCSPGWRTLHASSRYQHFM